VLIQGSAEKDTGGSNGKGRNANQVVLKQHANIGLYAKRTDANGNRTDANGNRTDANGNRTLEPVRKQLEEDGRKTALQSNGQMDKGNWKKEL
jgi:hypothetical protein